MGKVDLVKTGIGGLDHILSGGLPRNRIYLLEGDPGSGKTTLALQFLMEGIEKRGKVSLCLFQRLRLSSHLLVSFLLANQQSSLL